MTEEWRPIPGYDGYEASSLGRIRSLDRILVASDKRVGSREKRVRGKVLRHWSHLGYGWVNCGKRFRQSVHRLVALAFHGAPPTDRHVIAHNSGVRDDNRPENLRWATAAENSADMIIHGTSARGEKNWNAKLSAEVVLKIKTDLAAVARNSRGHAMPGEIVAVAAKHGMTRKQIWKLYGPHQDWKHIQPHQGVTP